jgi:hypothetical protein
MNLLRVSLPLLVASQRFDDHMAYNRMLFAGTHNSAINLGDKTIGRPTSAVGGKYPSEATLAYQYIVMDHRLSVRDQLEQGIRVIDLEVAKISGKWQCNNTASTSCTPDSRCVQHKSLLSSDCFSCCPFIVSHGSVQESVGDEMGFTYPEDIFTEVAAFLKENPAEIVTLLLLASHGNDSPNPQDVIGRLNSTGLLPHVWNSNTTVPFAGFPTLGEMRAANRTVMIASAYSKLWPDSPGFTGSHVNSSDVEDPGEKCIDGTPCMEGWDAVSFFQLDASRAILSSSTAPSNSSLFYIENLSSRRGRGDKSADYSKLPNELKDFPFQAGGNPAQAVLAADYAHVVALEASWAHLLSPFGIVPNVVLVDFFNTSTPKSGVPSRALLPNPNEGLIKAVAAINAKRVHGAADRHGRSSGSTASG